MKTFTIIIKSKNKISRNNFFTVLKIISSDLYCIKKQFKKKKRKKQITLLKSPHVNKKAQEQFEAWTFKKQLTIKSIKSFKYLILIKKLSFNLFSDIKITLKYKLKKKSLRNLNLFIFSPENFKFKKILKIKSYNLEIKWLKKKKSLFKWFLDKKTKLLLNTFDSYGELFKIYVWIAQLVEQRIENPWDGSSNLPLNKNITLMKNYLPNIFATIKNGQLVKRNFVYFARKKICESFLKILWKEGFISAYKVSLKNPTKLKIYLKYNKNRPVLNSLKFISKPSRRIYYSLDKIWKIDSSKLFIIFSTNKGLKTIIECKAEKLGGEPVILIN